MKKEYVADIIGLEYENWYQQKNKVFLNAPLGMGKTTFVVNVLLDYIRRMRDSNIRHDDKMLIICNRRMLRSQYWWALIRKECSYKELMAVVEVKSYQEIAVSIRSQKNVDTLLSQYSCIICDEVHFFYADSDFNGFGTFSVMHALLRAGISKMMLFMTATADEIFPILQESIKWHFTKAKKENKAVREEWEKIVLLNFQAYRNFDYVQPFFLTNDSELVHCVTYSSEKWLIFVDSKVRGQNLLDAIRKNGRLVEIIHADNLDKESNLLLQLVMNGQLESDILITTSVLDNGVSLKDPLLRNVVIMTDSRISFVQMLGRVRVENKDVVNLYLVGQNTNELNRRMKVSEQLTKKFEQVVKSDPLSSNFDILAQNWDEPYLEESKDYRKMLILATEGVDYIPAEYAKTRPQNNVIVSKKVEYYINELAREKIGDSYKMQSLLFAKAMVSPVEMAKFQISWIGKEPQELIICKEDSLKQREEELIKELEAFGIKNADETRQFKESIAAKYPDVVCRHIKANKGSFEKKKLATLCADIGFEVITETVDGKIQYRVTRKK